MNWQDISPEISDNENGQEIIAEEGNDFVGEQYASSEEDVWEERWIRQQ